MNEIDLIYEEFWKDIIEPNGVLDLEQIKKELYDFKIVMGEVSKVYYELTNGKISKPNTVAQYVIEEIQDCL